MYSLVVADFFFFHERCDRWKQHCEHRLGNGTTSRAFINMVSTAIANQTRQGDNVTRFLVVSDVKSLTQSCILVFRDSLDPIFFFFSQKQLKIPGQSLTIGPEISQFVAWKSNDSSRLHGNNRLTWITRIVPTRPLNSNFKCSEVLSDYKLISESDVLLVTSWTQFKLKFKAKLTKSH